MKGTWGLDVKTDPDELCRSARIRVAPCSFLIVMQSDVNSVAQPEQDHNRAGNVCQHNYCRAPADAALERAVPAKCNIVPIHHNRVFHTE